MRAAPDTRPSVGLSILSLFFVFGTILVLNPVGNVLNAVVWGDLRTLLEFPSASRSSSISHAGARGRNSRLAR